MKKRSLNRFFVSWRDNLQISGQSVVKILCRLCCIEGCFLRDSFISWAECFEKVIFLSFFSTSKIMQHRSEKKERKKRSLMPTFWTINNWFLEDLLDLVGILTYTELLLGVQGGPRSLFTGCALPVRPLGPPCRRTCMGRKSERNAKCRFLT